VVNTEKENIMSEKIVKLLEKLAEMFPKQDYQSRLEKYIVSRHPQNIGDIEHYERQFVRRQSGGLL
jgi:hypothetical protein